MGRSGFEVSGAGRRLLLGLGLALLAGCPSSRPQAPLVGGLGRLLVPGNGGDLKLSRDGSWAGFLEQPVKPKLAGTPPYLALGRLVVAPVAGGPSRVMGSGVPNEPTGFAFSPDAHWVLFLQGYNPASSSGELRVVDLTRPNSEPRVLGSGVSFYTVSPDSRWVAFVDGGVLRLGELSKTALEDLSAQVSTAEFSADSRWLLIRRTFLAGGALLVGRVGEGARSARKLGDRVGDYVLSPDNRRVAFTERGVLPGTSDLYLAELDRDRVQKVAEGTTAFAFSPDGKWLARTEGARPEKLGELKVSAVEGGAAQTVAPGVEELLFSPASNAVLALGRYDARSRSGHLFVAAPPDGKPVWLSKLVHSYAFSPDGRFVAFNVEVSYPLPSVDLYLYQVGTPKPFRVEEGVYGFSFSPDGEHLWYRSQCSKETRACELRQLELAAPHAPAKTLTSDVYSFKSSDDGGRILLSYVRGDADAYDTAELNVKTGQRKTLDQWTLLPAFFAAKDGSKAVYLISNEVRPGLYVVDHGI